MTTPTALPTLLASVALLLGTFVTSLVIVQEAGASLSTARALFILALLAAYVAGPAHRPACFILAWTAPLAFVFSWTVSPWHAVGRRAVQAVAAVAGTGLAFKVSTRNSRG